MNVPALADEVIGAVQLHPGGCISWIVAALVAGWLAGLLVHGRGFGCLGDIVLGLVGAFVGIFIISLLPLRFAGTYGFFGTIGVAFVGALVLAAIGRLIGGSHRRGYPDWH